MGSFLKFLISHYLELLVSLLFGAIVGFAISIIRENNMAIALCTMGSFVFRIAVLRKNYLQGI